MREYNIIEDISKLTHIKQFNLRKIASLYELDIANCIYESMSDDNVFKLDIGIGYLTINLVDDSVIYKFEPSKKLKNDINSVIVDKQSPLVNIIESKIDNKIFKTYKDIL
jgi:hypothetical protein